MKAEDLGDREGKQLYMKVIRNLFPAGQTVFYCYIEDAFIHGFEGSKTCASPGREGIDIGRARDCRALRSGMGD
ncbi:hypothetical protein [Paenibacillus dendritiformis]|uniref:hypothetical protein n=1 Tax=Paenibacillus dendritiformis TaxID=130049 RepID=UPI00387E02BD